MPVIALADICHEYGVGPDVVRAVDSVSLEVGEGETVCIVGPSGCGKSTLLKIMVGIIKPTSGRVIPGAKVQADGIGYVQQQPALLPWRTVVENAILGMEVKGPLKEDGLARIRDDLDILGLSDFENRPVTELSGGMMQKVALITALSGGPALLACDEPFSAVDYVGRLHLLGIFKRKCRVERITTVFVTHNIEEAIFLGHRVVVLSGRPGRVVETVPIGPLEKDDNAVEFRRSPEFDRYFQKIWGSLNAAI